MKEVQKKITAYVEQIEQFIDDIRELFEDTGLAVERANRNGVFNTLLNLATYSSATELEAEFRKTLPNVANETFDHIRNQLREINGVCTFSLSDKNEVYQNIFKGVSNSTTQNIVRNELSNRTKELIFIKTNNEEFLENYKAGTPSI